MYLLFIEHGQISRNVHKHIFKRSRNIIFFLDKWQRFSKVRFWYSGSADVSLEFMLLERTMKGVLGLSEKNADFETPLTIEFFRN